MEKEILKEFSLNLRMGQIESGPPLSTILGNFGINTKKFCEELSELTIYFPNFFFLEVVIILYSDKSYSFFLREPSVSLLLKLVSFKKEIKIKTSGGIKLRSITCVKLDDIYNISYFKFSNYSNSTLRSVYGTLTSLDYYIVK